MASPHSSHPRLHRSGTRNVAVSSALGEPVFTPAMRDRQARSSRSADVSDESDMSGRESGSNHSRLRLGGPIDKEDFGKKERRDKAVAFLDNPELLMMYAQSKGDSIPAARLHFMKMMCGYDSESVLEAKGSGPGPSGSHMTDAEKLVRMRQAAAARDTGKRRGGDRASGR